MTKEATSVMLCSELAPNKLQNVRVEEISILGAFSLDIHARRQSHVDVLQ